MVNAKELREAVKVMRQAELALRPNADAAQKALSACDLLKIAFHIERALNAGLRRAA